jgi:hypothetical protein
MYTLIDTFNRAALSNHRTLLAAIKGQKEHSKRLKKHDAFVTYKIVKSDGTQITRDEMIDAEIAAGIY